MSNPEVENYVDQPKKEPTLNEIATRSHENSKSKGFWDGQLDPDDTAFIPEKLMLIVSEAAEALESYRDGEPDVFYLCEKYLHIHGLLLNPRCACGAAGKPMGFSSELADIVIRVGDLAARLGIDLGKAVEEKHAYNATRAHKHGKVC